MGGWYRVVKTIKGHRYVYEQQTWREGGHVRTRNRYIGRAADSQTGSTTSLAGKRVTSAGKTAARASTLVDRGMVTTTTFYDPDDLSPAGRIKTAAIEKVFSRIPDGTTDPRGYVVKRNNKLFPTEKLTAELRGYIAVQVASDGSIIDGININKIAFTEDIALRGEARQFDVPPVTTTESSGRQPSGSPPASPTQPQDDAHRKYFTNQDIHINSTSDAVRLCREALGSEDAIDRDKEHFYVIHLNTRSRVTMLEVVSVGTISSSLVHPRETFRRAIAQGSSGIIIAHNHPSGEVDPSDEDTRVTKLMFEAGKVTGIDMLDHIVFSDSKAFSFRDNKVIES